MPDQNTYIFDGKDGSKLSFVGDRPPTPEEIAQLGGVNAPPPPPTSQIGPALRNTALPPLGSPYYTDPLGAKARATLNTPLINSGVNGIDSLTTPASLIATLVGGGMAAKEAQGVGMLAKGFAGMRGMLSSAAPQIKYEIVRSTLTAAHVPAPIAMATALAVSGFNKGGAKAAEAPAGEMASAPGYPRLVTAEPAATLSAEQLAAQAGSGHAVESPYPRFTIGQTPSTPATVESPYPRFTIGQTPSTPAMVESPYPRLTVGQAPPPIPAAAVGPEASARAAMMRELAPSATSPNVTNRIVAEFGVTPIPKSELDAARRLVESGKTVKAAVAEVKALRSAVGSMNPAAALAAKFGTPTDVDVARDLVNRGITPFQAAMQASGGNMARFTKIMSTFMQTGGAK